MLSVFCVYLFVAFAQWLSAAQVQEWKWLAEAVGCVHQLLLVLLQVTPGTV